MRRDGIISTGQVANKNFPSNRTKRREEMTPGKSSLIFKKRERKNNPRKLLESNLAHTSTHTHTHPGTPALTQGGTTTGYRL